MKRVKMLQDMGVWKKGVTYDMCNSRADSFLSKYNVDWGYFERTGKVKKIQTLAIFIKDLGRHIGNSKHTYDKNGRSEVFG